MSSQFRTRSGKLGSVHTTYEPIQDLISVVYAGVQVNMPGSFSGAILELEIENFVQRVDQQKGVNSNGISGQSASAPSSHPPPAQSGTSVSSIINSALASLGYGACAKCGGPVISQRSGAVLCNDCFTKLLTSASPTPVPPPPAAPPPRGSLKPTGAKACMNCGGGGAGPAGLCAVCHNTLLRGFTSSSSSNRIKPLLVAPKKPAPAPLPVSEIRLGEIIAWRGWRGDGSGYLRSLSRDAIWPPGEAMEGRVSSEEHGAGVYAFKSKKLLFDFMSGEAVGYSSGMIWGSVALWGDVVEHELGYRAQFAAIASLEGQFPADINTNEVERLRERYNVGARL